MLLKRGCTSCLEMEEIRTLRIYQLLRSSFLVNKVLGLLKSILNILGQICLEVGGRSTIASLESLFNADAPSSTSAPHKAKEKTNFYILCSAVRFIGLYC